MTNATAPHETGFKSGFKAPFYQDNLADRFGLKVAARLNEQPLPHDISERLRVARMQAIARMPKQAQTPLATSVVMAGGAAVLQSGGNGGSNSGSNSGRNHGLQGSGFDDAPSWFNRIASALPLLALLMGLAAISSMTDNDATRELAEIDLQLLTDDLPPAAHTDPGFAQFLKFGPPNP